MNANDTTDGDAPENGAVTIHHFDRDSYDGDDDVRFVADDLRRGELDVTPDRFDAWFTPAETVTGTTELGEAYEAAQGHVVNREQNARHMVHSASPGDVFEVIHANGETAFYRVARIGFEELGDLRPVLVTDGGENEQDDDEVAEDVAEAVGRHAAVENVAATADGALVTCAAELPEGALGHVIAEVERAGFEAEQVGHSGGRPLVEVNEAAPAFEVGEQVEDGDDDEPGTMRVLDADAGRADEVEVGTTGRTVSEFEGNEDYPEADRVVTCVFESALDRNAPGWTDAENLPAWLDDYAAEWGVNVRTYDYPESRLRRHESETEDDEADGPQDETDGESDHVARHVEDLREDAVEVHEPPAGLEPASATDDEDGHEFETAELREDEHEDELTHAEANAIMLRRARAELGREDDEQDDAVTDGGLAPRGAGFMTLPTAERVVGWVYPFPSFDGFDEATMAAYDLVREQIDREVGAARAADEAREVVA